MKKTLSIYTIDHELEEHGESVLEELESRIILDGHCKAFAEGDYLHQSSPYPLDMLDPEGGEKFHVHCYEYQADSEDEGGDQLLVMFENVDCGEAVKELLISLMSGKEILNVEHRVGFNLRSQVDYRHSQYQFTMHHISPADMAYQTLVSVLKKHFHPQGSLKDLSFSALELGVGRVGVLSITGEFSQGRVEEPVDDEMMASEDNVSIQ